MSTTPDLGNVHVERRPGVCGGAPVIRGTRFPVRSIVVYALRQGKAPEEIVREWPQLSLAQIHGALAYYYDHQDEIDSDLDVVREQFDEAREQSA